MTVSDGSAMPTTDQRAEGCFLQEQVAPGEAGMDVALLGVGRQTPPCKMLGVGHPRAPCCLASRHFEADACGLEQHHPRCLR